MERNGRIPHSKETLEGHARDLQGIEFLGLEPSQDLLDGLVNRFLAVTTENGGFAFTGQIEKAPSCVVSFPIHPLPIKARDRSPPRRIDITLKCERVRERRAFLDQDRARFDRFLHLDSPRKLQRTQAAARWL